MKTVRIIDNLLNRITMYRLVLYGLIVLLAAGIGLSLAGTLPLSAAGIALSIPVLLATCYIANRSFSVIRNVPTNSESWLITALILSCILQPATGLHHFALIALAGLIAMASKFLIAYQRKHLFNPAAIAALILGLSRLLPATWWIGSPSLLIVTAVFGALVLRKLRRFQLFGSFLIASLLVAVLVGSGQHQGFSHILNNAFLSSPLIFLGTIMLTEPETAPPLLRQQLVYGALVGALFTSQLHSSLVSATPELSLIAGNVFAYAASPKRKFKLKLVAKRQLAPKIYDFEFETDRPSKFIPGQYMEWTLPDVKLDSRGNRRTFSIASAPGDANLNIAIKAADRSSSFKTALLGLKPGESMMAGQLAGNFILPKDTAQKLVFIAGGIGITPFLSMARDMVNRKQRRDIVLFYLVSDPAEYCYSEVWEAAAQYGLKVIPVLTKKEAANAGWHGEIGRLTAAMLQAKLSDHKTRRYYLSGPSALVDAYRDLLTSLHIPSRSIVSDHFSGY